MRILTYRSFFTILLFFAVYCQENGSDKKVQKFGAEITLTNPLTLAVVYDSPEKYEGQEILLTGKISQVCQTRGCWMKLSDGERELIVRFKDYAFFVPKDAAASTVTIQGIFTTRADMHVQEESMAQEKGEAMGHHPEKHEEKAMKHAEEKTGIKPVRADTEMPYSFEASAVEIYPAETGI